MFKPYFCLDKRYHWFFVDNNETIKLYNIFFSCIAFRIYRYKMYCIIGNLRKNESIHTITIKKNVLFYCKDLSLSLNER